jgi:hypothetical protein
MGRYAAVIRSLVPEPGGASDRLGRSCTYDFDMATINRITR